MTARGIIAEAKNAFDRDKRIVDAFLAGKVPEWISNRKHWKTVRRTAKIDGDEVEILMRVLPDFAALQDGAGDTPIRFPLFPDAAQRLADPLDAILPSTLIAKAIEEQADVQFPKGSFTVTPAKEFAAQQEQIFSTNERIEKALSSREASPGSSLIAGDKKFVVVTPGRATKVVLYSPLWGQPYSGDVHSQWYVDYSHGIRFVDAAAQIVLRPGLEPADVDLRQIFKDERYHALVSDEGAFDPRFPNKGISSGSGSAPVEKPPKPSSPSSPPSPDQGPIALPRDGGGPGIGTTAAVLSLLAIPFLL